MQTLQHQHCYVLHGMQSTFVCQQRQNGDTLQKGYITKDNAKKIVIKALVHNTAKGKLNSSYKADTRLPMKYNGESIDSPPMRLVTALSHQIFSAICTIVALKTVLLFIQLA